MQTHRVSERDLELIHGLQIAPRVSWTDAGDILRVSPTTLANRWRRLRDAGIAWVTAHPGAGTPHAVISFVEVDCTPGGRARALHTLCYDPRVVSIEERAGAGDLLLTVITQSLRSMSLFVLDELPETPGVQRHRSHMIQRLHFEAKLWRIDALEPTQRQRFEALSIGGDGRVPPTRGLSPLVECLFKDGRAGAAEIARATRDDPSTVRRRLARLIGSGMLSFRCELAQEYSRWPINCAYFARVSAGQLDTTVRALATLPELRLCASTTGESNLLFTVWASSMNSLLDLEHRVAEHLPWLDLKDSSITLRTVKRMGWLLDEDGAATRDVVLPAVLRI